MLWLVSVAALIGVVLNTHRRRACFAIWACTNATWVIVDLHHGIYPQAALQLVYFLLSLYGLWHWRTNHGQAHPRNRI